jgi:hypothetical protein
VSADIADDDDDDDDDTILLRTRRSAFSGPVVVLCHLEGSSLESLELEEPELEVSLDGPQVPT